MWAVDLDIIAPGVRYGAFSGVYMVHSRDISVPRIYIYIYIFNISSDCFTPSRLVARN